MIRPEHLDNMEQYVRPRVDHRACVITRRIRGPERIHARYDACKPFIPAGHESKAAFMIEHPDARERRMPAGPAAANLVRWGEDAL